MCMVYDVCDVRDVFMVCVMCVMCMVCMMFMVCMVCVMCVCFCVRAFVRKAGIILAVRPNVSVCDRVRPAVSCVQTRCSITHLTGGLHQGETSSLISDVDVAMCHCLLS